MAKLDVRSTRFRVIIRKARECAKDNATLAQFFAPLYSFSLNLSISDTIFKEFKWNMCQTNVLSVAMHHLLLNMTNAVMFVYVPNVSYGQLIVVDCAPYVAVNHYR